MNADLLNTDQFMSKLTNQNKVITDLSQSNQSLQDSIQKQKACNTMLINKIEKLENEIAEQKEREDKLKSLHSDEIKYITDMNSHEINLFESKIK